MRNAVLIFIFSCTAVLGQRFHLSLDWPAVNNHQWTVTNSALLDTTKIGGMQYVMSGFRQKTEQTDFPYLSFRYQTNKFFIRSYLRYSSWKFDDETYSDNEHSWAEVKLKRFIASVSAGYEFRRCYFRPFVAGGLSVAKFNSRFSSKTMGQLKAYSSYVNSLRPAVSFELAAGIRMKAFTYEISFQKTFNRYDARNFLGPYTEVTYMKIGLDVFRSRYRTPSAYNHVLGKDKIKRSTLKDNSINDADFGFSVPVIRLKLREPFFKSYVNTSYPYSNERIILSDETAKYSYLPIISRNMKFSMKKRPSLYGFANFGMTYFNYTYKEALQKLYSGGYVDPTLNEPAVNVKVSDLKYVYWNIFLITGGGFKTVFGDKQFHVQAGIIHWGNVQMNEDTKSQDYFPALSVYVPGIHFRSGIKKKHSGVFVSYERSIGRIDADKVFKYISNVQIGFSYEIGKQ